MKRWLAMLLCLLMIPTAGRCMEGAYLTTQDLVALQPAFEVFVEELADTLVSKGLIQASERDAWVLYQLGDYIQNGGFGTISVFYTPGLLSIANEAVTMRRFSLEEENGTTTLDTLGRYSESYSALPGLPLDTEMLGQDGEPIPCQFRWSAPDGSFLIWDGAQEVVVDVGNAYLSDGQPLYWNCAHKEGMEVILFLEVLREDSSEVLATAELSVISTEANWVPEVFR